MKYYRWLGGQRSEAINEALDLRREKSSPGEEDLLKIVRLVFEFFGPKVLWNIDDLSSYSQVRCDKAIAAKIVKKLLKLGEIKELQFQTREEAFEYQVSL